ncbi:MAG: ATP-binding cassette domain-containing protein [Acidimicrobiia bacterium]|nr:ATP-binding cassette domain-containing protein [Acidimicrobiia bacterium]
MVLSVHSITPTHPTRAKRRSDHRKENRNTMTREWTEADKVATVSLEGIHKRFGRTTALAGVDFSCRPGEVHSLLGENGSGKSTLVKILAGVLTPDQGRVTVGEDEITRFTPQVAKTHRIATVFQEVLVAPNCSITTNVLLGQHPWLRWRQPRRERHARAEHLLKRLTGVSLDPQTLVEDLSLMRRHQVAVARALAAEPDTLVLDESTAALDLDGRDRLFEEIRALADRGGIAVFISHRLDEVMEIADRVTVLRSGEVVDTLARDHYDMAELLELMSGPDVARAGL